MIETLQIENWKAFGSNQLSFSPGLNLLLGPNASGKTTILDAIVLAIVGEAFEVPDFKLLVRDKKKPSTIGLTLRIEEQLVSIRRTFTAHRIGGAWLTQDNKEKQLSWEEATSRLETLLGANREFLLRIAYLSEGGTFRYLQDPPSNALTAQIESLFGIDAMQHFLEDLREFRSATRREVGDLEGLILDESLPSDPTLAMEATSKTLKDLDQELSDLRLEIQKTSSTITALENTARIRSEVLDLLQGFESALRRDIDDIVTIAELGQDLLEIRRTAAKSVLNRLGESQKQINVLDARSGYVDDLEKVALESQRLLATQPMGQKCPVCRRPLDKSHVATILAETKDERSRLKKMRAQIEATIAALQRQLEGTEAERAEIERSIGRLESHAKFLGVMRVGELRAALSGVDERVKVAREQLIALEAKAKTLDEKSRTLSAELVRIESVKRQLEQSARARARIVRLSASEMIAGALADALTKAIEEQRKSNVIIIQDALTKLWRRFRGHMEDVEFQPDGTMHLVRDGSRLSFQQLSGGEKTALLVLSHAIASRALSKLDFLLIDEPLEHLDLENRRSLMNFLVQAVGREFVPQLIVSTFEETLTRKYLEEPKTKALYL